MLTNKFEATVLFTIFPGGFITILHLNRTYSTSLETLILKPKIIYHSWLLLLYLFLSIPPPKNLNANAILVPSVTSNEERATRINIKVALKSSLITIIIH